MELMDYISCLFESEQYSCLSNTPKGTQVFPIKEADLDQAFISLNALHPNKDFSPTEIWHSNNKPRRADHNVISYRNILIEMDKVELDAQLEYIKSIELPYSTCVYSGNKSYHFIISLMQPLNNRKEYNRLVSRIYNAVGNDKVDQACKNPSRFTRIPNHLREDTKKIQALVDVKGRINLNDLESWLVARGIAPIEDSDWEDLTYKRAGTKKDISSLSGFTRNFLQSGKELTGGWNAALFKAAADFCRAGYDETEAAEHLITITGHLDETDKRTIQSAFNNERNQNG